MHKFRNLAVVSMAAGALAACGDTGTESQLANAGGARIASTTFVGAQTCPGNDTIYAADNDTISGTVTIPANCTFYVVAADSNSDGEVTIWADATVNPTALIISKDADIIADGTSSLPIVFTPTGTPEPAAWGGIVIIGNAEANCSTCTVEGLSSTPSYGDDASKNDENSGKLEYVRIEYAGYQLVTDNELNGLSLYSVGDSTIIDYVQVHRGSDDGIEFFGGKVNAYHLVSTGSQDDLFDYSFGWTGAGQYWIGQQHTSEGDKGIEADNDDAGTDNTPRTNPTIYNLTLVGQADSHADSTTAPAIGMQLRRKVAGTIRNAVVIGFGAAADGTGANAACLVGTSIFFAKGGYTAGGCTFATGVGSGIRRVDPQLAAPYIRGNTVDFRPRTLPAFPAPNAATGGFSGTSPAGVTNEVFVGAVARGGAEWYKGWTNFDWTY